MNYPLSELLAINERVPRRLWVDKSGGMIDSQNRLVDAKFTKSEIVTVTPFDITNPDQLLPYFYSQLGKGEYRGLEAASLEESRLIFGYDILALDDKDHPGFRKTISLMFGATEHVTSNAYCIGPIYDHYHTGAHVLQASVAYFKIPASQHARLKINPEKQPFKNWIKALSS